MADYHFPIALLRAPDDQLSNLTMAWANDSRGWGLIRKQEEDAGGGGLDIIEEAKAAEWYPGLSGKARHAIENHKFSDFRAWAASRARPVPERWFFQDPEYHVKRLEEAKRIVSDATWSTQSPLVFVPLLAWTRAFKDDAENRDIAIRDFRVLCGLYSSIGKLPARVVRRSEIIKRAFGFWAKDHSEQMVQKRIRETLPNGFTPRMIRDSLDRLDRCGEILRFPTSQTVTWYARGSSDAKPAAEYVYKRTMDGLVSRSRSPAAQMLLDKLKQEGTK